MTGDPGQAVGAPAPRATAPQPVILRPLRTGNAFEETVERLLQTIRLGLVPPGDRLPAERDLALQLGVSRATLRDALAALHAAGWVEARRGRTGGTFVRDSPPPSAGTAPAPTAEEVEDVLALRWVVEVGAVEVAARRELRAAERRELDGHLRVAESADARDYRRCDSRLHLALAEASGSPSLVAAVADARTRLNALLDRIPLLSVNLQHSNAQHRSIVAAVLAADPERARAAMVEHVEGSAALLRGFLS
ncbi:DNA-binding FadR family transcriptional regulator [Kineococcus xinjiangensis]|uniref:DNA-binding FadR family transcriptional regulator n=1 Tax=Kineococcus xinjiangensis TaxID=512762 RepID=A0A2S6IVJ0_9ACTN|nr:GntR family transcriptional regulator [Kineococcus xinjiangensis]PPK98364.1 DNA-binding FadR family transcriptional regulator [Kineococcus xinjiangensis]